MEERKGEGKKKKKKRKRKNQCTMTDPIRLTVLISGNGTNLQALIDKITTNQLNPTAKIIRVISNRKEAYGLERARKANIPTTYHNLVKYKKKQQQQQSNSDVQVQVQAAREEYDADLAKIVLEDKPDLVVCLGFMHVLSERFLEPLNLGRLKIINLHPALPGAFNGVVGFFFFFFG